MRDFILAFLKTILDRIWSSHLCLEHHICRVVEETGARAEHQMERQRCRCAQSQPCAIHLGKG